MGLIDRARRVAAQSLNGALSGAKDRGQAFTLQRRFNGLAEILGQVTFRARSGEAGLDAEIDRLVGEMTQLKAEMDAAVDL
jgi:hypothetical protein